MTILKIVAILVILAGVVIFHQQWRWMAGKEITTGVVTELILKTDSEGDTYTVAASFKDREGDDWRYVAGMSSDPPTHQVGEAIRIMYERGNPQNNYAMSFGPRLGVGWTTIGLGLAMLIIVYGWQIGDYYLLSRFPNTHG
ncbi:MAG: DUF3592 domain-containing protein [Pseudoxanthomonas sp.]